MSSEKLEPSADDFPWEDLLDRAAKIINKTIASLPPPIREHAEKVATLLEKWPPDDEDMLGQFHGFEENHVSETLGPLFIFIGPIYEFCREENINFEDEVRTTYLHELGHFLGMDEDDLEERGLS